MLASLIVGAAVLAGFGWTAWGVRSSRHIAAELAHWRRFVPEVFDSAGVVEGSLDDGARVLVEGYDPEGIRRWQTVQSNDERWRIDPGEDEVWWCVVHDHDAHPMRATARTFPGAGPISTGH